MVQAESNCKTMEKHAEVLTIPVGGLLASVVGGSSWERRDMPRCVKEDEPSLRLMSGYDRHISDKLSTLISVGTQGKTEMTLDIIHGNWVRSSVHTNVRS